MSTKNKKSVKKVESQEKIGHRRQNSSTLRKYGSVYENFQKEQYKKESEKDLVQRLEEMKVCDKKSDKKVKKKSKEKPEKQISKDEPCTKKPLNSYQLFFKEQRLAGKTPKEIGAMWKLKKE